MDYVTRQGTGHYGKELFSLAEALIKTDGPDSPRPRKPASITVTTRADLARGCSWLLLVVVVLLSAVKDCNASWL